jgi:hypothetical protein
MKIEPVTGPLNSTITGAKAEPQVSARERAIQALMGNSPNSQPVPNATRISPEEYSAVKSSTSSESPSEIGQSISSESPKAETSEESQEVKSSSEPPLSSQYAILARKEKALRQREAQLKAREAALNAPKEQPQPQQPQFDESKYVPKERLTQDPFSVLNELGLTYDQLTELALNAPKPEQLALMNEIKALKDELKAIKGETESTKKSFEETQKTQREQALNQFKYETKALVNNDPAFEMIKATNSVDDVVELIQKTFDEDGVLLTVEEAAQKVEDYLVEEAEKLARLSKIQQRLTPKAPQAPVSEKPKTVEPEQKLKTLTNSVSSSRPLTAKERAILAFQGKLQK